MSSRVQPDQIRIGSPHSLHTARQHASGEAEPWPAPRPLSAALADVCAFDPELLPEALRPWVVDLAERLQVPPDYPAAALTVMLAGALGRRASIRPQQFDNWVVVPNLWGAVIGRSGVMKSPVLHAVMGPLRRRQALAMAVYESEKDAYQGQRWKYTTQKRMRRHRSDAATEACTSWEAEAAPPPVCARYLINEGTIEKVH